MVEQFGNDALGLELNPLKWTVTKKVKSGIYDIAALPVRAVRTATGVMQATGKGVEDIAKKTGEGVGGLAKTLPIIALALAGGLVAYTVYKGKKGKSLI